MMYFPKPIMKKHISVSTTLYNIYRISTHCGEDSITTCNILGEGHNRSSGSTKYHQRCFSN